MGALADRPLRELLTQLAAPSPAPGGGCATGWTCALSAGLVEMTAAFTLAHPEQRDRHERMNQIATRAAELRASATQLAERELHAYDPVLAALRLPQGDPDRAAQLDATLSEAAETPLALARLAAEVAALALEASRTGTRHLHGDALTGLLLAEGACQAAARLVAVNLAGRPHDERLSELAELTREAAAARAEVL
jgi:methenyltetrahydrofolate cyclohydrolase